MLFISIYVILKEKVIIMSKREIYQGQIYICDLGNDNIGSEQSGERPCLVIQNNILNATSEIIIVIPITSKCKKVLCECIRSLSKKRVKKLIGQIDNEDLEEILKTKEYAYKNANKIVKERRIYEWTE